VRGAIERDEAATIHIDLRPDMSAPQVEQRLERRDPKQSLANALRKTLHLTKLEMALLREFQPDGPPRESAALAALIKDVAVPVCGVAGLDRAISTAGGVRLDQLDETLMLKSLPGLFFAGEMLDFDAPTGGYLLQAAFATGFAAGRGAARFVGLAA